MIAISARLSAAGHSFTVAAALFCAALACSGDSGAGSPSSEDLLAPLTQTPMLITVQGVTGSPGMPEEVTGLDHTAGGRFISFEINSGDPFQQAAQRADSSGMLILAVLPPGMEWSGSRDHLAIRLDSLGRPASVEPDMDSELLSDSLWTDPVSRQEVILELIDFSRPDIVLQYLPEKERAADVIRFWNDNSIERQVVVSMFSAPCEESLYRGWGVFTGEPVSGALVRGMTLDDFNATCLLLAGLSWEGIGYPAVEALVTTETE